MIKHLESLVVRGYQVTALSSGVPGFSDQELKNGITIKRSPSIHVSRIGRGFRRIVFPIWARVKLKEIKPDIVHIEGLGGVNAICEYLAARLLTATAKKIGAVTIKQHTLADSEDKMFQVKGFENRLRLNAWRSFDAVVSVSPALHQAVNQQIPGRSFCILNGVNTDNFSPLDPASREQFRINNGINANNVVFTFLGSIGYRKGFDLLARAFTDLSISHPNWHLWVIGPRNKTENQNINEDEVAKLTAILQPCAEKVQYWGRVDDQVLLPKLLGASDIFIFPSRKEGFPNAPLEAMACGLPVILSKIPGVTDQVNIDNVTGLYFDVGDIDSFKILMIDLGSNKEIRNRMGSAARERVLKYFSWIKYIEDWEELYRVVSSN